MLRRDFTPLTLANQLALVVFLLAALGVTGLGTAGWLGQGIRGSAHAINKAGSLRMQSYRLLATVPIGPQDAGLFEEMSRTADSGELRRAAERDGQIRQLNALSDYWRGVLAPALKRARDRDEVRNKITVFVNQIDSLVSSFDKTTEQRIQRIVILQQVMIVFMGLLLIFTVIWLRKRLLQPWKKLLSMANAIGRRNFSYQVKLSGRDEMATLASALNTMSTELAESYAVLEQRVMEKTRGLERTNQMLSFLYQSSRHLHSPATFTQRVTPVLNDLQQLTPLRDIELRVYEHNDEENYQEYTLRPDNDYHHQGKEIVSSLEERTSLKWRLTGSHTQYGLILAQLPIGNTLNNDQQQMLETLIELLTTTLALERQNERQQQLIVMEERAAIARELHDSIAQSLSCMKMQVSCLQMQGDTIPASSRELLSQIRGELNTSWRQLRELLTTFRLQLTEPGLRPALESSSQEFSARLGFPVTLDYRLPPRCVPGNQAIHLVQIAREALNNTFKHAHASAAGISVSQEGGQVRLIIWDNGCGITGNGERSNHYGLIIMRDRAHSLKGSCQVRPRDGGGTEVIVDFIPGPQTSSVTGAKNE